MMVRRRSGGRAEDLYARWNVKIRDTIIFLVGVIGVVNELFLVPEPRPAILLFLGSLIGIPFVLSADEKRNDQESGPGNAPQGSPKDE